MMDNVFEAIRGCIRYCFEECVEKGAIYGVNLDGTNDVINRPELLNQAYQMIQTEWIF